MFELRKKINRKGLPKQCCRRHQQYCLFLHFSFVPAIYIVKTSYNQIGVIRQLLGKTYNKLYLKGINFHGNKLVVEINFREFKKFVKVYFREILRKQPFAKVYSREMCLTAPLAKVSNRQI